MNKTLTIVILRKPINKILKSKLKQYYAIAVNKNNAISTEKNTNTTLSLEKRGKKR